MRDNLVIFGPTASGKSSLALEVARKYNGEIINMDSMQVYRGMDIITAKPSVQEMGEIEHHLFSFLEVDEDFSVYEYKNKAVESIAKISSKGKNPLLVGGTGLYLSSLYYDYAFRDIDINKREKYREIYEEKGLDALRDLAREAFPHYSEKIDIDNPHRLLRLLESGRMNQEKKRSSLPLKIFILDWEREALNQRIEKRINLMLEEGLIEEVEEVYSQYGRKEYLPALRGIGYKEYLPYLEGHYDLERAREKHLIATRQYAKRQRTWARNQYKDAIIIKGELSLEKKLEIIDKNWR